MKIEDPPPDPQTDSRSGLPMKNRRRQRLRLVERDNSSSLIFLGKCDFIVLVSGSAGPLGGDNPPGRAWRGWRAVMGCAPPGAPPVVLGCRNSLLLYKKSSQSFVPFRELLFLHKNNTMVVLLKTSAVWG